LESQAEYFQLNHQRINSTKIKYKKEVIMNNQNITQKGEPINEEFIDYIVAPAGAGLLIAFGILLFSTETKICNFIIDSFKTYWWICHNLITVSCFIFADGGPQQKSLIGLKVWRGLLLTFFIVSTVIATKPLWTQEIN
jgi:hypothetical protein